MFRFIFFIFGFAAGMLPVIAQDRAMDVEKDRATVRKIFDESLERGRSYDWLRVLCKDIGPRLSGSAQMYRSMEWGANTLKPLADTIWSQPVMVPHWERGKQEEAAIKGGAKLTICALGGSIATPPKGLTAPVVEVQSLTQLADMGADKLKGKIVFFNRAMDARQLNTFHAYGSCVDQRASGAAEAARFGAVGVLVRSMNLRIDDYPHTGNMRYKDGIPPIPAAAISTADADMLSRELKAKPDLQVRMRMFCRSLEEKPAANIIAEIRGSEKPEEIILVGGHLDSWDLGEGAHDDGAGCVQAMEVLRIFRQLGLRPRRTVRVVLFANEENGVRGGRGYAEYAIKHPVEKHIVAIESDKGGFAPRGFSVDSTRQMVEYMRGWLPVLEEFDLHKIKQGGAGTDITPLRPTGALLIGFEPDTQRYFEVHHAATDTFESVNRRELEMGAAALATLVWLFDQYGLPTRTP